MSNEITRALALVAAEIHLQNMTTIAINEGRTWDRSLISDTTMNRLVDAFCKYTDGDALATEAISNTVIDHLQK